ncbi:uncharacterized protein E0L32_004260 [Thyridium curvatum]|uniref:GH64 domain-containing protein n=1 Tax=Thyridium curvatum TaxID=1093900 RepID=A0A507AZZ7_9PEZI|nr:uncharacterized protein E0L32_004260 [Thyridium curvatum]TPX15562.1 hypothetical protein E0L32_004260 [Thyridium curvatum]
MGFSFDSLFRPQQQQKVVEEQPPSSNAVTAAATTPATTQISLKNTTPSANVYVTVTGLDTSRNNARWLLQSDGATGYWPASPGDDHAALAADCSIALGGPGSSRTVAVPHLAGARIYFSRDRPLHFELNRGGPGGGAALVEPSITNAADANYGVAWDFCEFTYDDRQLFVNITYVDFVSIPTALQLESETPGAAVQRVAGIRAGGLDDICARLQDQQARDGAGWGSLVVKAPAGGGGGGNLRALSPNSGMVLQPGLFAGYYEPYVDAVWAKYRSADLRVDTQGSWGVVTGRVGGGSAGGEDTLDFPGVGSFPRPSTRDVFSCDTGAFARYAANGDEMGNITARLAAALNRSTLLLNGDQPDGERAETFYPPGGVTNHYARILHAASVDGRGYAFPYDDVGAEGAPDQAGTVFDGAPKLLTVYIGGFDDGGSAAVEAAAQGAAKAEVAEAATANVVKKEEERSGGDGEEEGGGRLKARLASVRGSVRRVLSRRLGPGRRAQKVA